MSDLVCCDYNYLIPCSMIGRHFEGLCVPIGEMAHTTKEYIITKITTGGQCFTE